MSEEKQETQEANLEATVSKPVNKTDVAVRLLEEKLCREYDMSLEDLRNSTIIIKDGVITVKGKNNVKV